MWYNFPLLVWTRRLYGATSLNKAWPVLSTCPRTNSTWHQETAQPWAVYVIICSFCSFQPCSFVMTDGILKFSLSLMPSNSFHSWSSGCTLYLEISDSFSAKQLSCLPVLCNCFFSRVFQGWSHYKPHCKTWVALLLSHESWSSEFYFHVLRGKSCLVCALHSPT